MRAPLSSRVIGGRAPSPLPWTNRRPPRGDVTVELSHRLGDGVGTRPRGAHQGSTLPGRVQPRLPRPGRRGLDVDDELVARLIRARAVECRAHHRGDVQLRRDIRQAERRLRLVDQELAEQLAQRSVNANRWGSTCTSRGTRLWRTSGTTVTR